MLFRSIRYIPGYGDLRRYLVPVVSDFLQGVFDIKLPDIEDEIVAMQSLIILYVFSRSSAVERNSESPFMNKLNFWAIKATCESFATHLNLHRSADAIKREIESGRVFKRTDHCVRKYLYWLWLYTTSHKYLFFILEITLIY